MRLIPEYEPVGRLYLSFVQPFFNSRFHYGKAICEIAKHSRDHVDVEIFVSGEDRPFLLKEMEFAGLDPGSITLNPDSPKRGILAEYMPIFGEDDDGRGIALLFTNSSLDLCSELYAFSQRVAEQLDLAVIEMDADFATAAISINEELSLVSESILEKTAAQKAMPFLESHFPSQSFIPAPSLAGDVTGDLDMYLWPIKPRAWLASQYPAGTPQEQSIEPALHHLERLGHEVHRVPGLDRVAYDDINTMPNYANGIILNDLALYPAYQRKEDDVVREILESYGYKAIPIDCSDIILSNSGIHCISKTVPRSIMKS